MLTKPHTIEFKPIATLPANADEATKAAEKAPWDLESVKQGHNAAWNQERMKQGHTGQVALTGTELARPIMTPDAASVGLSPHFGQPKRKYDG